MDAMRHKRSGRKRKDKRIPASVRVNMRMLAGVASYFNSRNIISKTRSDLVHNAIEAFHELLVGRHLIEPFASDAEGVKYLQQLGFDFGESDPIGVSRILAEDSLMEGRFEDESIQRAMERLRELEARGVDAWQKEEVPEKKPTLPGTGGGIAPMLPDNIRKKVDK